MDHKRLQNQVVAGVAAAAVAFASDAGTIYVDDDNCPGPGSGTELDPYCSIQVAIATAAAAGDEIVVAPGTYVETVNLLGKAVTVRSTAGPQVTVIDANGLGRGVVCTCGEGAETVLEGFTITGGSADSGGGMYVLNSSPTVSGCIFATNTASINGGGVYLEGSNATLADCVFNANTATINGGGIHLEGSSATLTDCMFSGNVATFGGAMFNNNGSNAWVSSCEFVGNSAAAGGGLGIDHSLPVIAGCTFEANTAPSGGGGIYNTAGSDPLVMDCMFSNNWSVVGGGIASFQASSSVVGCTFTENTAEAVGGGIYNEEAGGFVIDCRFIANSQTPEPEGGGGGMTNINFSEPAVINCLFWGNTAAGGGSAIVNALDCAPTLANCTVVGNTALGGEGGAMWNIMNCHPWVWSSIFWDNDGGAEIVNRFGSYAPVDFSNVQGGYGGTGNIDSDPLFVDAAGGDFRLSRGSPCIDGGDNEALPPDLDTDLDGNPRFLDDVGTPDGGNPDGIHPMLDMGAYEFAGTSCMWDCSLPSNGEVNFNDILAMISQWGNVGSSCDFDGNGVGVADFLAILMWWGPCP